MAHHPLMVVRCSSDSSKNNISPPPDNSNNNNSSLKEVLSGMVDERVEMLLGKEENKALLQGLEDAALRVEMAKKQLAEFDRQEAEAQQIRDYVNKLQSTTSEIAECQKEISEAKAMVDEAYRTLEATGAEESSLLPEVGTESIINKDEERVESVTAAIVSAVVGTLAGLPLALTRATTGNVNDLIVPLGITFVSCALYGVTFRYAVRRDLDNFHLKSGTSAAFGIVKALATLGAKPTLQQLDIDRLFPVALDSAVYISENLLIFSFAGVALDFCIKSGFLSPYPIVRTRP
ncbi:OLC1v1028895C1 [Oldenlandia corymbosa var. corymbosa]|uniref:OLC1v1028895C1 n=1 Tax=Oldenlandia corymbosa var. corymbosa TaxID=529605 RepID=A0AAV1CD69_OLDCO|nr:OLC1v1028895C1 [Oldenlandia corymbosa var. corymbosa]